MAPAPTILVFDSGLGGLTVFREVKAVRPDARFIYLADDAGFPYGNLGESVLIARIIDVLGNAVARYRPDLVVVACNTASTLALAELRARFAVPFVGTVPAIKPACAQSKSKRVAVLGTQATVDREYTRGLIREFASGCDVHLVGSSHLAGYAEAELAGQPVADNAIKQEIGGCFVEGNGRRTDTIVLACTHYPLLLDRFRRCAPWPVIWLDPASAIARRVADLMRGRKPGEPAPAPQISFTSGRTPSPRLGEALAGYGF
jgi:glutamate racemase